MNIEKLKQIRNNLVTHEGYGTGHEFIRAIDALLEEEPAAAPETEKPLASFQGNIIRIGETSHFSMHDESFARGAVAQINEGVSRAVAEAVKQEREAIADYLDEKSALFKASSDGHSRGCNSAYHTAAQYVRERNLP